MKTKEEKVKANKIIINTKITVKRLVILLAFFAVFFWLILSYFTYKDIWKTYGKEDDKDKENVQISKAEPVNIDKIMNENLGENGKEEIEKKEVELEYITKYKTNNELPKGMIQVVQEGRTGTQEVVTKKVYNENNEVVSEEQLSAKVKKASLNKIVEIGGANYTSEYNVQVGDTVYATSDRIAVMLEPNEESQKVATLSQGTEFKVLAIQENWYNVKTNGATGWVKTESTSYINPNEPIDENKSTSKSTKSKTQLLSKLSFEMKLNEPSGLSLEQFKKVLSDSKDTKKILQNNAQYFYYIEKQYNINGVFVASMAIHESAWGTSKIANEKRNLFGYGAYDSNPYNGAYDFSDYSECIDLIARVLVKYYLNPAGTKIYGGEVAAGTYYKGPNLTGVNTCYASDKGWANKVYNYMQYLYNKL